MDTGHSSLDLSLTNPLDSSPPKRTSETIQTPTKPPPIKSIEYEKVPEKKPLVDVHPVAKGRPRGSVPLSAPSPAPTLGMSTPPGGYLSDKMSKKQQIRFNIMLAFIQIIPQSTLTTVFPSSKVIAKTFYITDPATIPWVVSAYALTFGTFILIGGRLGDIFGHKKMVIIGFCTMAVWSLVAGLSHLTSPALFFLARAIQGIGASMLIPNGIALLGVTYAPGSKQKIVAFTIFGACAPVGAFLGFLFGGVFAMFLHWWWSFYVLAIVTALFAVLAKLILKAPPQTSLQTRPAKVKLRDMDWWGAFYGVTGLVLVQVAIVSAPAIKWTTPYIYFILIIGLLLVSFFVVSQFKISKQPLVPFKTLKADVGFVLAAVGCGWGAFGVWSWFLWLDFMTVKHMPPFPAAVHVVPMMPFSIISAVATAVMLRKLSPSFVLLGALLAFTLGCILLGASTPHSPYWSFTFVSIIITPWGMNMSFAAATYILSDFFAADKQGVAGSMIATVMQYSISLGLALGSTVEVHANSQGRDLPGGVRAGFYFGIGVGALGVLICLVFVARTIIDSRLPPIHPHAPKTTNRLSKRRSNTMSTMQTLFPTPDRYSRSSAKIPSRKLPSQENDHRGLLQPDSSRPPTEQEMRPTTQPRNNSWGSAMSVEERYEYNVVTALPRTSRMSAFPSRPSMATTSSPARTTTTTTVRIKRAETPV